MGRGGCAQFLTGRQPGQDPGRREPALCLSCERRGDERSIIQGASAEPVLPLRSQKSGWVGGQGTCEKHTGAECQ